MATENDADAYFKKRIYSINHPGMNQAEMVSGYNGWAKSYDVDLTQQSYDAPQSAAAILNERYPPESRKNMRVLDVGAGTGLVADKLAELGFGQMDALDPVKDMLDVARSKGKYQNYYEEFLSADTPTSIQTDTYDCVTGAGCFGDNHIPWNTIPELIRVVKQGGLIVIATKIADTDYYKGLWTFLDELVRDGKLSKVELIRMGRDEARRNGERIQRLGETYDVDVTQQNYDAPQSAAAILNERYPSVSRKNVRVLDVGAGTGLVADKLVKLGFCHMDALDPIKEMLDLARGKGKYTNYYEEFLSADTPSSIPSDTYDCVTGAGCFGDNHIPWNTIPELIRVVKKGGLIVMASKMADTDYFNGLWTFLDELVRDGKLSKVELIRMGRFVKGTQGIVYVLTVS